MRDSASASVRLAVTPPYLSIALLSASALAYEVLLLRLFSIIHWHHFAAMIISLALLGYGMSGSLIAIFKQRLMPRYQQAFRLNALLFAIASVTCFVIVQYLPFNSLEILWDHAQWWRLLFSYLMLALPFFFVANAIALSLMYFPHSIARIYGIDLVAAGAGALMVLLMLEFLPPEICLRLLAMAGLLAVLGYRPLHTVKSGIGVTTLVSLMVLWVLPPSWLQLQMSPYKGLQQLLQVRGVELQATHYSPIARTDVVASPDIGLRYAPGLSLNSKAMIPSQLAVFADGDAMQAIDQWQFVDDLAYHGDLTSALPYYIHNDPSQVLVLNAGSGSAILQAALFDAQVIDAVEAERISSDLFWRHNADETRLPDLTHRVTFHHMAPRGFNAGNRRYDLVVLGPPASSSGGAAGVHALATNYDMTIEALATYLQWLAADGSLSITHWTDTPPRSGLRLFATAVAALSELGVSNPAAHIAWIRSWNTSTLVVKRAPLTTSQISRARKFSSDRAFDISWLPGIHRSEVNRFQVLAQPIYYRFATEVLTSPADAFFDSYKYRVEPATDDRPFANLHFKWSSFRELVDLPSSAGLSLIGIGYPTMVITLLQALAAALVLIVLPLFFLRKSARAQSTDKLRSGLYFLSIGLAFLFIEIAFIQKSTLILSQPLYAVALTLSSFLLFSGLGSLFVQYKLQASGDIIVTRLLRISTVGIVSLAVCYAYALPSLSTTIMQFPQGMRTLGTVLLSAPLAFVMGMPFPLGLSSLINRNASLVPWAWGINGCASVLSAILAVLLAIEIGFSGVMLSAAALYAVAWTSRIRAYQQ